MVKPSSPVVVSVIVTAHNYGRFLDQCIQSVLTQTYPSFDLVVVDDGSEDETTTVLERYEDDPKVSVHRLAGVGLAAACNYGIRHSRGKFILRLDADDFLDRNTLMVEAEILTHRPEIGLVYTDFHTVDEAGRLLGRTCVPRIQEGERLLDSNPLAGGAMVRRTCYEDIGGYNETLRYQEDYDFWLRFTERFQAYGVGLPLLFYRQHAGSMSRNRVNRSAARRYVKRQYVEARHISDDEMILIAIPGVWPGAPERSESLLNRPLGNGTAIGATVEAALMMERGAGVIVSSDNPEVRQVAARAGAVVIPGNNWPENALERPALAWLRSLVRTWNSSKETVPDLIVIASPYCPFRHPERFREIVDTLLIHRCDLVISIADESPHLFGSIDTEPVLASSTSRLVREAGELLAVRTSWLMREGRERDACVGYVEMLHPEWLCIKDEEACQVGQGVLAEVERLNIDRSRYLHTR